MAVLKEELVAWRNNPVTQELMMELRSNCENYVAEMIKRGKPDGDRDQWIRAYVSVVDDVLGFDPKVIIVEAEEVNDVED